MRTKLSLEQQLVAKIKKQMEMQDDMIGQAASGGNGPADMDFDQDGDNGDKQRKRGSTFLKMFRFDMARTPKNAAAEEGVGIPGAGALDQSVDYANYLLEIQEGKEHILHGLKTKQKQRLIKGDVQKEKIDFYDLRHSGGAATEPI